MTIEGPVERAPAARQKLAQAMGTLTDLEARGAELVLESAEGKAGAEKLLIAHRESHELFADLKRVIVDELHALVTSKRGDLLALGLARLRALAPDLATIGLSATALRVVIPTHTVQPGDSFECYYTDVKPDRDIFVNGSTGKQGLGGHHIIMYYTVQAMPVGVQIMGQQNEDARITAMARWLLKEVPPIIVA